MRTTLCLILTVTAAAASHCGHAAIPFTFQALRSGKPVLGCARPRCFGWNKNGSRADDTARFYRINGKEDGYLRRSDDLQRAPLRPGQAAQLAKCDSGFRTRSCGVGEWVGGISPFGDPTKPHFQIQCCSYALLIDSEDRGVAPVKAGHVYIGGEVVEGPKLVAFDYISDITKRILEDGSILYEVSVRRMNCTDEMTETPEEVLSNNALIQNLEGDIRIRQDAINEVVQDRPVDPSPYGLQPVRPAQYGVQQQPQPQTQQLQPLAPVQGQQPSLQAQQATFTQQTLPQPFQQPQLGQYNSQMPFGMMPGFGTGMGLPQQSYQQLFPNNIPQAPQGVQATQLQPQVQQTAGSQPRYVAPQPAQQQQLPAPGQIPFPTMAPLPKLDELPQIQIPTVEQVEEVIPPMQKAILTNIAKFFGVL